MIIPDEKDDFAKAKALTDDFLRLISKRFRRRLVYTFLGSVRNRTYKHDQSDINLVVFPCNRWLTHNQYKEIIDEIKRLDMIQKHGRLAYRFTVKVFHSGDAMMDARNEMFRRKIEYFRI